MIKSNIKYILMHILNKINYIIFFLRLKFNSKPEDIKIVIGSSAHKVGFRNINYKGWLMTDLPWFDIQDLNKMLKFFSNKKASIILAEHVFEHLDIEEGYKAIKNLKQILCKNGKIRLAVPDGYHSNQDYITMVKPHGSGGAEHKILYNYKSIKQIFDKDFEIRYLEYFDERKNFIYNDWQNDYESGYIKRSRHTDYRNDENTINYSSLIIDAILKN